MFVGGPTFEVNVVENTPSGTVIIRLEARDADEGLNGRVSYSFAPSTLSSPAVQVFSIRNDTGELTVKVCSFVCSSVSWCVRLCPEFASRIVIRPQLLPVVPVRYSERPS